MISQHVETINSELQAIQSSEIISSLHFFLYHIYITRNSKQQMDSIIFIFTINYTAKTMILDLYSLAPHAQSHLMQYRESTCQCLAILPLTHPLGTRISAPWVSLYSTDPSELCAFPCHFQLPFNEEFQSSITSSQENVKDLRYIYLLCNVIFAKPIIKY